MHNCFARLSYILGPVQGSPAAVAERWRREHFDVSPLRACTLLLERVVHASGVVSQKQLDMRSVKAYQLDAKRTGPRADKVPHELALCSACFSLVLVSIADHALGTSMSFVGCLR